MELINYPLNAEYCDNTVTISAGCIRRSYVSAELEAEQITDTALCSPYLSVNVAKCEVRALDGIGLYETRNASMTYPLGTRHIKVRTVDFIDRTDIHDALVLESERTVYHRAYESFSASLYIITDIPNKVSLVILSDAPYFAPTKLEIKNQTAVFYGAGWGAFFSICKEGAEDDLTRAYYRAMYKCVPRFSMSNTWGDRSGGKKLCADFIRKEIDCAASLGVDIVQIDDGWEKGDPYAEENSINDNGREWAKFSDDFWEHNTDKFPDGLRTLASYALQHGVRLGIWFAPCTYNGGELLGRDAKIIKHFHDDWDVRYVKIDFVELASSGEHTREECIAAYLKFLDGIAHIGQNDSPLQFNLDITASDRLGYFGAKQYGTLFVENRYTDWGNYYPHNTLRNLWQLSRWIPADKFQFELLNPRRNADKYTGDALAPCNYDMDYLFASVMVSNPLVWLEMQNLASEDADALKKIISVWKSVRADFDRSVVYPIGACPDGISFTGFYIVNDESEYLLLFRELDDMPTHTLTLPVHDGEWEVLASNTSAKGRSENGIITCEIAKAFGYALLKYKKLRSYHHEILRTRKRY